MSLSSLMNLGSRAMFAQQAQIQTTGHNIANASVAGYSRQEVVLATATGQYTGAGYFGRGVDVQTVTRSVNSYLTSDAALTKATAASDSTRENLLKQLEKTFGTGESGIGYVGTQFLQAFSDVAAKPDDLSARQVVLSRAGELASMFQNTSAQMTSLQSAVKEDVQNNIKSVNDLANQIANVNAQLTGYYGDQPPNDLLDKRDQLVSDLSQHVQVTRVLQSDGSINLFIGGSQSLVVGANAYSLTAQNDATDASKVHVAINVDGHSRVLDAATLGGGSLQGLMSFQDNDLTPMLGQLNTLAESIGAAVNTRQTLGIDLNGAAGQPLFSYTPGIAAQSITLSGISAANLAAGNPVVASTGADSTVKAALTGQINATNAGTGAVASVVVDSAATADPTYGTPLTLVFTNDTGGYQIVDNSNPTGAPLATGTWSSDHTVSYNGYTLNISGVPKNKDAFTIQKTSVPAASNGNALAMVGLTKATLVNGSTFTNAYASTLADIGVRVQGATRAADVSAATSSQKALSLTSQTGVNLDEEAARLIQFQQGYQAAAKILQVAQKVFDTVLSIAG